MLENFTDSMSDVKGIQIYNCDENIEPRNMHTTKVSAGDKNDFPRT